VSELGFYLTFPVIASLSRQPLVLALTQPEHASRNSNTANPIVNKWGVVLVINRKVVG